MFGDVMPVIYVRIRHKHVTLYGVDTSSFVLDEFIIG